MSALETMIVVGLVTLAVTYVIYRARRKRAHGGGCEGHCGCGKAASVQTDRRH